MIWNVINGNSQQSALEGTRASITSLAFLPGTGRVVSASGGDSIAVRRVGCGNAEQILQLEPHSQVILVACSPNGQQIACGCSTETSCLICVWDNQGQQVIQRLDAGARISVLSYSSESQYLAAGCISDTPVVTKGPARLALDPAIVKVWNIETSEVEQTLVCQTISPLNKGLRHSKLVHKVTALAFSHDRRQLAAATSYDAMDYHSVEVWKLAHPDLLRSKRIVKMIQKLRPSKPVYYRAMNESISMLRFTPDDSYLMTSNGNMQLRSSPVTMVPRCMYIRDRCLYYGDRILFMVPVSLNVTYYDIDEKQVAIGLGGGQVATFEIQI